uniref:tRNA 5-carboxymethoxyuridine methyltransferase n=1 Tax=uncultured Thiotrichaceae bacterium TaxID=298394 RepID=A0A6S6SY37_9GAMM|nr:MAG: tRNA 5-carboxymethoxyuridine methyltransferase [uncultured Thiotrichaceae bacterium]
MKHDRIFDGLAQRFQRKIYSNNDPRGQIRLHIVQQDLMQQAFMSQPLSVLDAGGGMGQMTHWLAGQGHSVTMIEPSEEMLQVAQALFEAEILFNTADLSLQRSTIQEFVAENEFQYDFIVCHAVLEWLAEPRETLEELLSLLKPGGHLSVMFFNQYSKEMRHLLGGDLKPVLEKRIASNGNNGLAPISPLIPAEVEAWLPEMGLELLIWSGVRCFYDYSHPEVRKKMVLDEVLELERRYSQQEPWRSIARYQHMVCRKL